MPLNTNPKILISVKRVLGLGEDYDVFDEDVAMHINSAFARLHQLGVGPSEGFALTSGDEVWDDFIEDVTLNTVKSYVYNFVRLRFDNTSLPGPVLASLEKQIEKDEWLLNVAGEEFREPILLPDDFEDTYILDGGE